jgi:superfamily II DNA/RNA helicase
VSFLHIDGSMNQAKRLTAVTQYNSNKIHVLLISKAGGEGLDLKETKFMILMDPGWNPGTAEQVIGRGIRYKSHYHLPKDQQHVDVYKLFLIKQSEAGQAIPTLDEMREQEIKPAVDLYLRALANDKIETIKYFMDMIRPLSIENNTC